MNNYDKSINILEQGYESGPLTFAQAKEAIEGLGTIIRIITEIDDDGEMEICIVCPDETLASPILVEALEELEQYCKDNNLEYNDKKVDDYNLIGLYDSQHVVFVEFLEGLEIAMQTAGGTKFHIKANNQEDLSTFKVFLDGEDGCPYMEVKQ